MFGEFLNQQIGFTRAPLDLRGRGPRGERPAHGGHPRLPLPAPDPARLRAGQAGRAPRPEPGGDPRPRPAPLLVALAPRPRAVREVEPPLDRARDRRSLPAHLPGGGPAAPRRVRPLAERAGGRARLRGRCRGPGDRARVVLDQITDRPEAEVLLRCSRTCARWATPSSASRSGRATLHPVWPALRAGRGGGGLPARPALARARGGDRRRDRRIELVARLALVRPGDRAQRRHRAPCRPASPACWGRTARGSPRSSSSRPASSRPARARSSCSGGPPGDRRRSSTAWGSARRRTRSGST